MDGERCDRLFALSSARDLSLESPDLFLVLVDVLDEGITRMSASMFERLRMSDTPGRSASGVGYAVVRNGVRLHVFTPIFDVTACGLGARLGRLRSSMLRLRSSMLRCDRSYRYDVDVVNARI